MKAGEVLEPQIILEGERDRIAIAFSNQAERRRPTPLSGPRR
jgi:hypothetical protein